MNTLRVRLSLYFTVLFGALAIAICIGAYAFVRSDAYARLDSRLQVVVDATVMAASHELDAHRSKAENEAGVREVAFGGDRSIFPDVQIMMREGDRLVAFKGDSEPDSEPAHDLRKISSEQLLNSKEIDGVRLAHRSLFIPQTGTTYEIYSGDPVEPNLADLHTMRQLLYTVVPFGLMVAGLGGYLLATRTLAPLQQLTQTIDSITSSNLSARVPLKSEHDELGQLGQRFNSLLDRLQQTFDVQRRFMADASHELRTPLTIALTSAQVTLRDSTRTIEECEEALRMVEQQMLRLKRTVQDMFFLSQADAASLEVEMLELDLDEIVADAGRAARALAQTRQHRFSLEAVPEARCIGNEELLKKALLILIDNAFKYTPRGGSVSVALKRRGSDWVCSVSDSGIGVPPDVRGRIFDRFFRANPTTTANVERSEGAGLGLAIARSILDLHHGTLTLAHSEPGFTTFELSIPAIDESATAEGSLVQSNLEAAT